ncbi:MAG: type II toxin-antitoxin system HicB family antitoxin [Lachnospiraceae bacterium]|nr:type II toxin-antitoxin system HicB family antitoxin [Lachnospiraceae bacterium]
MTRQIIVVKEDNWYVAKDIWSDVASQGKTMDEAIANLKEALELYYDDNHEDLNPNPSFITTLEVFA